MMPSASWSQVAETRDATLGKGREMVEVAPARALGTTRETAGRKASGEQIGQHAPESVPVGLRLGVVLTHGAGALVRD